MKISPPSKDIIELMLDNNVISKGFVGSEPAECEETFVMAMDVGGNSNPRWLRDENRIHIRVKSRRQAYEEGWNTVQAIKEFLLGKEPVLIGNVYYVRFIISSDVYLVSYDDHNRPTFAVEFVVTREYAEKIGNRDLII
jgi:hypothetical protein